MSDYWTICIEEGFAECGIKATKEQINFMVGCVEGGHENYGMCHGHDAIPNPRELEIKRLEAELEKERNLEHCHTCNGTGRVTENFGIRSSNSPCYKCNGAGKI